MGRGREGNLPSLVSRVLWCPPPTSPSLVSSPASASAPLQEAELLPGVGEGCRQGVGGQKPARTAPPCPPGEPTSSQGGVSWPGCSARRAGFRSREDQPLGRFSLGSSWALLGEEGRPCLLSEQTRRLPGTALLYPPDGIHLLNSHSSSRRGVPGIPPPPPGLCGRGSGQTCRNASRAVWAVWAPSPLAPRGPLHSAAVQEQDGSQPGVRNRRG